MLFCQYRYLAVEYLLVAVLNNLSSMRVSRIWISSSTHYLDINHADIVARIDLTEWETNPESTRYLTFLKGRVGRKSADFFMDFLGASEGLNAAQNRGLLRRSMISPPMLQLDKSERQNVRQQVYAYCTTSSCRREKRLSWNLYQRAGQRQREKSFSNLPRNRE